MAPFIPRLSDLTANLRELLRKDTGHDWNNIHQKSLQEIKDLIYKEMLQHYYDSSKKSVIQVETSSRGLGAALIQEGKPIAFASKSLTEIEQRYANIEWELLAVVFGCKRFRTYIYGCAFEVESDHKPLGMICPKNLTATLPRLQRMLLRLQEYDMVIKYRPGKEMLLADGLSRFPNKKKKSQRSHWLRRQSRLRTILDWKINSDPSSNRCRPNIVWIKGTDSSRLARISQRTRQRPSTLLVISR